MRMDKIPVPDDRAEEIQNPVEACTSLEELKRVLGARAESGMCKVRFYSYSKSDPEMIEHVWDNEQLVDMVEQIESDYDPDNVNVGWFEMAIKHFPTDSGLREKIRSLLEQKS